MLDTCFPSFCSHLFSLVLAPSLTIIKTDPSVTLESADVLPNFAGNIPERMNGFMSC